MLWGKEGCGEAQFIDHMQLGIGSNEAEVRFYEHNHHSN